MALIDLLLGGPAGATGATGESVLDRLLARQQQAPNPTFGTPPFVPEQSQAPAQPTPKQVAAVQTAKDPSLANILLGKLGKPGRALMPVSKFLGEVGGALEDQARRGRLGSLAPTFSAGVQNADRADLNRRFIEAQIQRMTAPQSPQRRVQSTQILGNGNIGYVDAFTGDVVDTGTKAGGRTQVVDVPGQGQMIFDPVTKTLTPVNPEENIVSSTEDRSAASSRGTRIGQAEGDLQAQPIQEVTAAPKAIEAGTARLGTLNDNLAKVRELKDDVSGLTTGLGGVLTSVIPGSASRDFAEKKKEVESFLALDKIAELKAQSATGATGLGAVNEREFDALQKAVVNLDQAQSPKQVSEALDRIDDIMTRMSETIDADIAKARKALGQDVPEDFSSMSDEELQRIINGGN